MKNIIDNLHEAMDLVDQILQFDECSMMTIISMVIDTASAKYKEPAGDIADLVCAAVHAVNAELGPYTFKEVDYDHKD